MKTQTRPEGKLGLFCCDGTMRKYALASCCKIIDTFLMKIDR